MHAFIKFAAVWCVLSFQIVCMQANRKVYIALYVSKLAEKQQALPNFCK